MKPGERISLVSAYILHRHDWRETSSIIEVFSRDQGRLGLVALGARRPKSAWRPWLRPFQPLLLSWVGGRELATLTGAEPQAAAASLSAQSLMSGFYLNELLLRLLPRHDPHPGLFDDYARALVRLASALRPALRLFEKELLAALGYGLNLERDAVSGEPLRAEAWYCYVPERGPLRTEAPGGPGVRVRGASLLALAAGDITQPEHLHEAQQVTRAMLDVLFDGRPLKTREVMRAFGKMNRSMNSETLPGRQGGQAGTR